MQWDVDIEMEVSSIKTFKIEADSRAEAIKIALQKAMDADWDEPKHIGYHLMQIDRS
jgi:hypothetical protein